MKHLKSYRIFESSPTLPAKRDLFTKEELDTINHYFIHLVDDEQIFVFDQNGNVINNRMYLDTNGICDIVGITAIARVEIFNIKKNREEINLIENKLINIDDYIVIEWMRNTGNLVLYIAHNTPMNIMTCKKFEEDLRPETKIINTNI